MEREKFEVLLVLIVPQIVKEITEQEGVDAVAATEKLYESKLYSVLEHEETKLWHLSSKALYEMYKEERQTGKITFPEEA